MLSPRVSHGGRAEAEADPEELKSEEREREGWEGRASGEDWIGFCGGGGGGGGDDEVDVADCFRDSGEEATFSSSSSSSSPSPSTSSENKEDEKPK